MKGRIGWKILVARTSCCGAYNGKEVYYPIRKWAKQPKGCGPLCVFDTREHATDSGLSGDIVKCKYAATRNQNYIWGPDKVKRQNHKHYKGSVLARAVFCLQ